MQRKGNEEECWFRTSIVSPHHYFSIPFSSRIGNAKERNGNLVQSVTSKGLLSIPLSFSISTSIGGFILRNQMLILEFHFLSFPFPYSSLFNGEEIKGEERSVPVAEG